MKKNSGFTLIELLVVLGVMGVLIVVGLAGLVAYSREQALKNAARELRTNLRFAQSKAIVGEKPTSCTSNLTAYSLEFSGATSYSIKALCSAQITVASFKLPTDVTKSSGAGSITFTVSTGSIGTSSTITLSSTFVGTEIITIDANGVIK